MKTGKRILSVKIKRITDDSPDTSYLGEYSNRPTSEYSIDRAHSLDCASVNPTANDAVEKLERSIQHLNKLRLDAGNDSENTEWESLDEAIDLLIGLQDEVKECDCSQHGRWSGREYRYFNPPVENYKGESPEDIRKYCLQDYERMESLSAGNWCYIGIRAEAEIGIGDVAQYPRKYNVTTQRITSGGLWSVESDSGRNYLESIGKEELADLKTQLLALGFGKRAIATAFKSATEVDA